MVRRALQSGRNFGRAPMREVRAATVARSRSFTSPVGGWNARDSLSRMPPTDAVRLENWFPRQTDVVSRPGYAEHCDATEDTFNVKQLIPFEYGAFADLLACVNGKIVDVTTSTPSDLVTGLTNDDWSYDYMNGEVHMANGADSPRSWDGSTLATPAWTGPTLATLNHVHSYKNRMYFVQEDTQTMHYGATNAVSGALTSFDFSTVAPVRGNLLFTTHLKGDGGDGGNDDVFVAVFRDGDVLAYTGSDFGSDVNLVGHYRIGRPLGRLAHSTMGDDVIVITERGYEKLSESVRYGAAVPNRYLLSKKIQQAVVDDGESVGFSDDWRLVDYPKGQMFIVTVPRSGTSRSYNVQNINTEAWCRFTAFVAYSWAVLQGRIYFGGEDGIVYEFDDGTEMDNGAEISCVAQQAWSDLGHPSRDKMVTLIRPYFSSENFPGVMTNTGANYETIPDTERINEDNADAPVWDVSVWDEDTWVYGSITDREYGRNATGKAIGLKMDVRANGHKIAWNETMIYFNLGGYL